MRARITRAIRHASQSNPTGIATSDAGVQRTWIEFEARVARLAGAMIELGIDPGSRVMLLSGNCAGFLEVLYATLWAGGVCVPVNTRTTAVELAACIDDCNPEIVFISADLLPLLQGTGDDRFATLNVVLIYGGTVDADDSLPTTEALIARASPAAESDRGGDDLALICYTGGTTGRAKGVMLSHANMVGNCANVIPTLAMHQGIRYLHASPMFHALAVAGVFATTMVAGTHLFLARFSPQAFVDAARLERATHTALAPTMIGMLVEHARTTGQQVHDLQLLFYGGSSMPERVAMEAHEVLPNAALVQGYGLTETSPTLTLLTHTDHFASRGASSRLRSAGQPVVGVDVAILDQGTREVPRGATGEICARGPTVFQGYWNRPEASREALREGWFRTGDVGYMDEDGYVYVVDRLKDMIISGGENVYSAEVENAIHLHPAVFQCAVFGVPSERWGEAVHASVRLKEQASLTEEELQEHCRRYIAGYKVPKTVEIRQQPFPMSGAGKILKGRLRQEHAEIAPVDGGPAARTA